MPEGTTISNYSKTTNFTAKDALATGNPSKKILGSLFDTEFDNIATSIQTKAETSNPTFTGTVIVDGFKLYDGGDDHFAIFSVADFAADRTVTIPLLTGNDTFVFNDFTATLTNKTINLTSNTLTGTAAQFNTAVSDDNILFTSNRIDDDTMATASATNVPSAESVKAYVDNGFQPLDADLTSWAGITRASGFDTFVATPSSANLASLVTDETGTGSLVLGTNPALTAPTITGTIIEDVYNWASTSGAVTTELEPANGSIQTLTLTGNITSLTDNIAAGEAITLIIDDGTAYTITWPTMTWVNNGAVAPTLATSAKTVVVLWKVSTTLYGVLVGDGT